MASENIGKTTASASIGQQSSDEISLKDIILTINAGLRFVLSNWLKIALLGILGAVMGVFYAYTRKAEYVAKTSFVLEESGGGGLGQYAGLASVVGIDIGGGGGSNGIFQGDNLMELYKSRSIIEKTLLTEYPEAKNKLVIDKYIEINKLRDQWAKNEKLKNIQFNIPAGQQFSRLQDSIINEMVININKNYLSISRPDTKLSIIMVKVTSTDESFAKCFNELIVKNVNNFYVQTKTKKTLQNLAIFQHQTDSIRSALNGALAGVATALDANPNVNTARQILRVPSQKKQIDAEANKAILTQLVQNLELTKVSLRKETPLIQVIDEPVYPLERAKLGRLKAGFIGGFVAAFLTVFVLFINKIYKKIIA
jgi:hypothetical protein